VILVDANLLIYAHSKSMPQHQAARTWLDGQLNGHGPVGLPWPSLLSFLRILSNPRAVPKPSPVADLWRQVREWLAVENVWHAVYQMMTSSPSTCSVKSVRQSPKRK
jgi:toxin-antitoxin system PIN domain toxin